MERYTLYIPGSLHIWNQYSFSDTYMPHKYKILHYYINSETSQSNEGLYLSYDLYITCTLCIPDISIKNIKYIVYAQALHTTNMIVRWRPTVKTSYHFECGNVIFRVWQNRILRNCLVYWLTQKTINWDQQRT